MNRIAIYLRLSEEDYKKTDESVSIVNQRDYVRNYIENENSLKDCEIEEYIDDGFFCYKYKQTFVFKTY